jgi:hypothetical protein
MMANEKRQHPRAEITWPVTVITHNGPVDGRTQNISLAGTLIRCPEVPDLNDHFRLVFKPAGRQMLLATGEMIWSDILLDDKYAFYAMGVRFTYLPEHEQHVLGEAVSEHI